MLGVLSEKPAGPGAALLSSRAGPRPEVETACKPFLRVGLPLRFLRRPLTEDLGIPRKVARCRHGGCTRIGSCPWPLQAHQDTQSNGLVIAWPELTKLALAERTKSAGR